MSDHDGLDGELLSASHLGESVVQQTLRFLFGQAAVLTDAFAALSAGVVTVILDVPAAIPFGFLKQAATATAGARTCSQSCVGIGCG
jgi:hypothetical protein